MTEIKNIYVRWQLHKCTSELSNKNFLNGFSVPFNFLGTIRTFRSSVLFYSCICVWGFCAKWCLRFWRECRINNFFAIHEQFESKMLIPFRKLSLKVIIKFCSVKNSFLIVFSEDGFYSATLKAPPRSGDWSLVAISLSPVHGLRVSKSKDIQRVEPATVELYGLPEAINTQEGIKNAQIRVKNNLPIPVQVIFNMIFKSIFFSIQTSKTCPIWQEKAQACSCMKMFFTSSFHQMLPHLKVYFYHFSPKKKNLPKRIRTPLFVYQKIL